MVPSVNPPYSFSPLLLKANEVHPYFLLPWPETKQLWMIRYSQQCDQGGIWGAYPFHHHSSTRFGSHSQWQQLSKEGVGGMQSNDTIRMLTELMVEPASNSCLGFWRSDTSQTYSFLSLPPVAIKLPYRGEISTALMLFSWAFKANRMVKFKFQTLSQPSHPTLTK